MNPYWSYILTAIGVFGLWLAGRKDRRGWMVGVGAQFFWIAYATATHQWGFYISAIAYGWVYIKNARAWKPKTGPYYATCDVTGGCSWKSEPCNSSEEAIKELDDHLKLFQHPQKNYGISKEDLFTNEPSMIDVIRDQMAKHEIQQAHIESLRKNDD